MSHYDDQSTEYVIDINSGAETARLMEQDKLFTRALGGLFPPVFDLSPAQTILDLGCGPGGWALEVAFTYPHMQVVGIDKNEGIVRYALAQARIQQRENVTFEVMDIREGLDFPSCSFDMINARFIVGFMDTSSWSQVLTECRRILKPGGIFLITEGETGISTSPSLQHLNRSLALAFKQQGRSFSADGVTIGITHMLKKLLIDAGFQLVTQRPFILDASFDSEFYYSFYREVEITFMLLKPYLLASGVLDENTFTTWYTQVLREMREESFTSITYGLSVWGVSPTSQ